MSQQMIKEAVLKDQAHRRLLDAVISLTGADQNGSREEVRAAAVELEAATRASQKLLYPEYPGGEERNAQILLLISPFFKKITWNG